MRKRAIVLAVGILLFYAPCAMSGAPDEITYQGRLLQNGSPVTDTRSVTFALYAAQSGGGALWTDTQSMTPDNAGVYTVTLGSSSNLIPTGQDTLWLQVTVAGTALSPRQQVTSAPYALNVGTLPELHVSGDAGIGTASPAVKLDVNGAVRSKQIKVDTAGTYVGLDVSGCNTIADTHLTGTVVIDGLSGGVAGQIVHIFKVQGAPGTTLTIKHRTSSVQGEQITVLANKTDLVLGQSDYGKGLTLVNIDGWGWYEIHH